MDKRSPLRLIYNLLLITVAIVSVAATGVISFRGYRADRTPKMESDKQIIDDIKQEYLSFNFYEDDIWNIAKKTGENSRNFTADVSITQTKELCKKYYRVQTPYKLVDRNWYFDNVPGKITLEKTEWSFQNSKWSASTDGIMYIVSLLPDMKAEISIEETKDAASAKEESSTVTENDKDEESTDEADVKTENTDSESTDVQDTEAAKKASCKLAESNDKESLEGIFHISKDKDISLIITEDTVKLNSEEGEVILKRE